MIRRNIFLGGWEYNRLLAEDPFRPRNSALPVDILWHGSAQLWLFEEVWCSKESLANEITGFELLGWTSGLIFRDLVTDGTVRTVNWETLEESTKLVIESTHRELRTPDPRLVRCAITTTSGTDWTSQKSSSTCVG